MAQLPSQRQGVSSKRSRARRSSRPHIASRAVFPGSFDPLTNGHVDIIERSLEIFDEVIVGVVHNPSKNSLLSMEERERIIKAQFKRYGDRVSAVSFSGLLVEFVRSAGCRVIIRGLRAISDFDYEAQMALVNRRLAPKIETFFLTAREEHSYVSSTVVKQVAMLGGDVSNMVPPLVAKALSEKYRASASGRRVGARAKK
jgi:pantetheine-phosphate adenylyltransferase